MGDKEKNVLKRFIIVAISVTILTYIVYQAYMMIYDPIKTEIAHVYTVEDTVQTEVFVARDESYITNKRSGTIISVVNDGSRVAKGQEVAVVFSDTDAAATYTRLKELEESIDRYKKLANQTDNYTFDINDLDSNIDNSVISLVDTISSDNFSQLSESINDVRNNIVTRQIATGNSVDFGKKLQQLEKEYDELSKKSSKHSTVVSNKSGYYISGTDGLEKIVDCSKVRAFTVDDIYEIFKSKPETVPEGSIGKIVNEFSWYFLCVVDSNSVGSLEVGDALTVNLPFSSVNNVHAVVYAINENTGDKAAVILTCNLMNSDISSLRHETAELVIDSYTGFRINARAVRVNDKGEKGVYVRNGNMVEFRKINIIYSGDDYVLSSTEVNKDGYVKLYDNIIVEGKDLYDGKVI